MLHQGNEFKKLEYLSNPADAQNVSCLGLCSRDICPKSSSLYGPGTFKPKLLVSS